jgi:hypothetical protein
MSVVYGRHDQDRQGSIATFYLCGNSGNTGNKAERERFFCGLRWFDVFP